MLQQKLKVGYADRNCGLKSGFVKLYDEPQRVVGDSCRMNSPVDIVVTMTRVTRRKSHVVIRSASVENKKRRSSLLISLDMGDGITGFNGSYSRPEK